MNNQEGNIEYDMEKINKLPKWRLADHLTTPEEIAAYLNALLEEEDLSSAEKARMIAGGLGEVCKDRGMKQIAINTGFRRESLYKALSGKPTTQPEFNTVFRVMNALGVTFKIVPIEE